jgi:hypothetical protein
MYAGRGQGVTADCVQERNGILSKISIKLAVAISKHFYSQYIGQFFERNILFERKRAD